jgi:Flp pilus assembly pilin Flp
MRFFKRSDAMGNIRSRDDGSVALEYGLIAAFVVVVVIVALVQLRSNLIDLPLPTINSAFDEALS